MSVARTVVCPDCSTEFSERARYCTGCGKPRSAVLAELTRLAAATERPIEELIELDQAGKPLPLYPTEARRRILLQVVHQLSDSGWEIVSQTDTTAQLKRPKEFGCALLLLTLAFGLGILIYILTAVPKIYIEVDELGRISATGQVDSRVSSLIREMNHRT